MKIAVVGCGAVGSFYGAKLARAGHDLHFLLRSDYEAVRRNGVWIHSPQGDFQVRPQAARAPGEIGESEMVLVALKATANHTFPELIPPLAGPETIVLTLQNGLGNEDALARLLKPGQIMGGLCFVCLNRVAPGVVRHIDHGQVVVGEFSGSPKPRTHRIARAFQEAGIACSVSEHLAKAHWEKLVWNIPFNGLGVAGVVGRENFLKGRAGDRRPACLTTDVLLADPQWREIVTGLMREAIAVARALGFDVDESHSERLLQLTTTMGPYKASTLLDFERGLPIELESLFLEPLRQARAANIPTPQLERLCQVLQQLQTAQDGARGIISS